MNIYISVRFYEICLIWWSHQTHCISWWEQYLRRWSFIQISLSMVSMETRINKKTDRTSARLLFVDFLFVFQPFCICFCALCLDSQSKKKTVTHTGYCYIQPHSSSPVRVYSQIHIQRFHTSNISTNKKHLE